MSFLLLKSARSFCSVFLASQCTVSYVSFPLSLNFIWHEVSAGVGMGVARMRDKFIAMARGAQ